MSYASYHARIGDPRLLVAHLCMLTSFMTAPQQLHLHVFNKLMAENSCYICCKCAQGGGLEGWIEKAREIAARIQTFVDQFLFYVMMHT